MTESFILFPLTSYDLLCYWYEKKSISKGIIINQDHFVQTWYKIYEPDSVKNKY